MQAFEIPIQVRYAETDAMGVVHHSSYFVWLELVRVAWLKSLGIDYKQMEQEGFFLPVVQADLTYKLPAFFDDVVLIKLFPPEDCQRARFTLIYELFRQNTLIAKGFTVHAFINTQRKLIKPPSFFVDKMLALKNS